MAHDARPPPAHDRARRSIDAAARGAGAGLCRALRDQPRRSSPTYLRAQAPRARLGRGRRAAESRRWSSGWPRLGYRRRCRPSRCPRRGRWARAAMASGGSARRCAQAGIGEDDGAPATRPCASDDAAEAALRFARRRRIGPFAEPRPTARTREQGAGGDDPRRPRFRLARRDRSTCRPDADAEPQTIWH